ncbi:transmembrane protein 218-like [Mytilus galloprovincialis]|uniref:Transmembrane protein 218 n=1 Tax=Mytilus galloprovincialis TaxID=29158 RepID=A0A8B6EMN5_MYTGA|nr:Hypothetical predicted protein [Mytilus galloprovincialis]VDI36048.1 Hypothetical predicted protein [Mytilus galloprovincialis]VDI56032.1 Hypothetical predicted protein [Mytilus galloprovincialis]
MATVLGVGPGLFTLALIWSICLLLCLLLSRAEGAIAYAGIGSVLFAGLITVILVVLPREPKVPTIEESVTIFDYGIIYRYLMIAGCALFIIIGLVAYLSDHMMMPIYAKPIRRLR